MPSIPPLRYLAGADVIAAMPAPDERLALAELTLRGLAGDAEMPPKIGVHPRPDGAFGHAMPAYLPGDDATGAGDLVGMKWVMGYPTNTALGLPGIHGTAAAERPRDRRARRADGREPDHGGADRRHLRRRDPRLGAAVVGRAPRAAVIGAGVQGRATWR